VHQDNDEYHEFDSANLKTAVLPGFAGITTAGYAASFKKETLFQKSSV